jgi:hypothetical protein
MNIDVNDGGVVDRIDAVEHPGDITDAMSAMATADVAEGVNKTAVAEPQKSEERALAQPEDMSDDEFDEYINGIIDGEQPVRSTEKVAETVAEESEEAKEVKEVKEEPAKQAFKTFASEAEYQAEIDRIFSKRHKAYKEVESEHGELVELLKDFYDVEDTKEAVKLFRSQVNAQRASDKGMSVEDYEHLAEMEKKSGEYDKMMNAREEQATKLEELRTKLEKAEKEIQLNDPEFNLSEVYRNDEAFRNDLNDTDSVFAAYIKRQARLVSQNNKKNAQPGGSRRGFSEEGAKKTAGTGVVNTSAATMSDDEFDKYINNILNE